jgi:creatinine amidohydrolase/Fe(II)-dependent formamide hydrolase-like protein
MLHLRQSLVDMNAADDTDKMTSRLKTCPVDLCSGQRKQLFLSTWYLEDSLHGVAGDPSCARPEFGRALHEAAVEALAQIIEEFYDVQTRLAHRKPRRKCTTF